MSIFLILTTIIFLVNFSLAFYMVKGLLREGRKEKLSIIVPIIFLLWLVAGVFLSVSEVEAEIYFLLLDFSLVFGIISFVSLFHWLLLLIFGRGFQTKRLILILYAPLTFFLLMILFGDFVASLVEFVNIDNLVFYWIALIYDIGILSSMVFVGAKSHSGIKKKELRHQAEYFLIAVAVALLGFFMIFGVSFILSVRLDQLMPVLGNLIFSVILYSSVRYQLESPLILFSSPRSIKTRVVIPIMTLIVSILIFFGVIVYVFFSNIIEKDVLDRLNIAVKLKVERVETFFSGELEVIGIMSNDHHLTDLLLEKTGEVSGEYEIYEDVLVHRQEVLDGIKQHEMYEVLVLDESGEVVMSTDRNHIGENRNESDYFIKGNVGSGIGEAQYFLEKKEILIPVYAPIKNPNTAQVIGVIVAMIEKTDLDNILTDTTGLGETGETFLVDDSYNVLTPIRFPTKELEGELIQEESAKDCFLHRTEASGQMLEHRELISDVGYQGEDIFSIHEYIPSLEWCMVANIAERESLGPVNELLRFLFISGFFVIVVIYFIIIWISRKITNPIIELRKGVELIEKGERGLRVGTKSRDEVGQLSRAFDKMTVAITESESEIDKKVLRQTADILEKKQRIEEQQRATLNILEDVEKERDKAEILANDLEKFRLAVENTSDHIAITDPHGVVVYINNSMKKDIGFLDKDIFEGKIMADSLWRGLMDKEFYDEIWKTIRDKKEVFVGEMVNQKANGAKYESKISISPVLNRKGEILFFVSIERDITREKEIDRAKTEFVSLASHQLRTPLSAVNWYAEMLLSGDAGKITKKQKQYIDEIYIGNQRMVELVNALLNVSRIELGTFSIDPKPTNIVDIFNDSISELKQDIKSKKLKVTTNFEDDLPIINLDSNLMGIVLQNILSNAVKYTPEKGRVDVGISRIKEDIVINVSDSGYGIPKEQQDRIFEKLFRADNVRERETDGTGLGLYIVKAIIDQSGGKVWFESEEDKGTTFCISIPLSGMKKKEGQKGLSPT